MLVYHLYRGEQTRSILLRHGGGRESAQRQQALPDSRAPWINHKSDPGYYQFLSGTPHYRPVGISYFAHAHTNSKTFTLHFFEDIYREIPRTATSVERSISLFKQNTTHGYYSSNLRKDAILHLMNKIHHHSLLHVLNASAGSIPAWLGSLGKLESLDLSCNQLTGERATRQRDRRIPLVRHRPWRDMCDDRRNATFHVC